MLKIGQKSDAKQLVHFKKFGHFGIRQKIWEHKHEVKVAATVAIVIITFTLSWLPSFIAELAYFPTGADLTTSYNIIAHSVFWCLYISPSINPLIYAGHNKKIRELIVIRMKLHKSSKPKVSIVSGVHSVQPTIDSSREVVQNMNPVIPVVSRNRSIIDLFPLRRKTKFEHPKPKSESTSFSDEIVRESDAVFTDISSSTSRSTSLGSKSQMCRNDSSSASRKSKSSLKFIKLEEEDEFQLE